MEELKGFLKDAWQAIEAAVGWLIQFMSNPANVATVAIGAAVVVAIIVVLVVGIGGRRWRATRIDKVRSNERG